MTSEQALDLIEEHAVVFEGGPEILSDHDLKHHLTPTSLPIEKTGYCVKAMVRVKADLKVFIYQVTVEAWSTSDAGGKELHKLLAKTSVRLGLLTTLTSRTCPI